jgi:protein TonB
MRHLNTAALALALVAFAVAVPPSLRAIQPLLTADRAIEAAARTALAEVGEAPPAELPDSTPSPELAPAAAPEREPAGPALELPLPVDPEYLPARLLDVLPRPVAEVSPRYPEQAAGQDLSGVVTLLLYIDELGIVTDVTVLSAEPPGYFEEAAMESFRNALFQPGQRDGRAVKSRLAVEVSFDASTGSHRPR